MPDFEIVRSTTVAAPAERVHELIEDFHHWRAWSPWEDVDPSLTRDYSGPDKGVGARYAWSGNRKAGKGTMEITGDQPSQIAITLAFEKPIKATNAVTFTLAPAGTGTEVTWRMTGTNKGMHAVFARVFSMDKLVGKDFEKGLARLKATAES